MWYNNIRNHKRLSHNSHTNKFIQFFFFLSFLSFFLMNLYLEGSGSRVGFLWESCGILEMKWKILSLVVTTVAASREKKISG